MEVRKKKLLFSFYERGIWWYSGGQWTRSTLGSSYGEQPTVLYLDPEGSLWAGYPSGRVTLGDGTNEREIGPPNNELGVIAAIYRTSLGIVVTGQHGLALLKEGHLHLLHFANDQLTLNVTGVVQSNDGDLWLNGQRGVSRISAEQFGLAARTPEKAVVVGRLLREADLHGPTPLFYDLPTAAKDRSGRLWFNTSGALVYVDDRDETSARAMPIVSVTALMADGVNVESADSVPPDTRTLRIAYMGSNLTAPEDVRYRYQLVGIDESWQDVEDRSEAVYTRLRPGSYTFRVEATTGDGLWTPPAIQQFRIKPTLVQTWQFRLVSVLLFVGLAFTAARLRVRSTMRLLHERAEERVEERVRIARELHDTLLQGLQGLMLRFYTAAMQLPAQSAAREQVESALVEAEKVMVEGRNHITRLRSDHLGDLKLTDALVALCEELSSDYADPPRFHVQEFGGPKALLPAVKRELYWLAREALINSVRHASASEIAVEITYGRKVLSFICRDDGRGIDDAIQRNGGLAGHFGLLGMRERAQRLCARFRVSSAPAEGTVIEITLKGRLAYSGVRTISPWRWPSRFESQER